MFIRFIAKGIAAAFGVMVAVVGNGAEGACDPFPKVEWWGSLSHESVIGYVERHHGGDWAPYVEKWEGQLEQLQKIYDRGSSIKIKSRGISLKEDELLEYVKQVQARLTVMRCIRDGGPAAQETDTAAIGDCEAFPEVEWWTSHDHDWVIDYVKRRHDGDWAPYIEKWAGQLKAMKNIHERGGAAVIKSRGVSLEEDELLGYVENLRVRLEIIQCLARADGFDGLAESSE